MMEHERMNVNGDGDSELSFEALTFGDGHGDDKNGRHSAKKKDKFRKKPGKKEHNTPEGEREKSSSVYISTTDGQIDVQPLLRKLEQFGVVRGYYFKEKQNFGIVQFVEPSVVDAVLESFDSADLGFHVTVERTSRTKEAHASPHSFGSMPATPASVPSTSLIPSTPPPEKPDTILVLKNLPFTLKQDQLHEILLSLSTTIPQSISLHYDNAGVFRGMAFIKYRQIEDAIQVYELLNGMDVGGRKVRVEYKRKPANNGKIEIPMEWQEDEELRRLWEQLNDFKNDHHQIEWYYPSNLSNNQKRNIYNMTEKLKLVQCSTGDNEVRILYLRKTPISTSHNSSISNNHSGYGGQLVSPRSSDHMYGGGGGGGGAMETSKSGRSIEIKGRRPRHDSETVPVRAGGGSSPRGDGSRSSVGRNEGAKTIASSAPADMNLDWRGAQPSQAHSFGSHQFTHSSNQQSQQQQQHVIAPLRQPKGPDGSKGFGASRKQPARTAAFLGTAEVSV